jgi:hypothetical protein
VLMMSVLAMCLTVKTHSRYMEIEGSSKLI